MTRRLVKAALCLWLWGSCFYLFAQPFKQGNIVIGPMYQTQLLGKSKAFEKIYGIQASGFITDNWSLEYSMAYADVPFGDDYGKFYGGSVLSFFGLKMAANSFQSDGWLSFMLFSLIVPEGISYHIPVNKRVVLSPFVNILTVDAYDGYWRMSNSAGVRLNMMASDKINIAPYAFGTVQYRGHSVGGSVGGFGIGATARWVF